MAICRVCGADAPPEKAWCPQCNQPLEPEEKRRVDREIDTFAGTMAGKPRPVLELDPPVVPPRVKVVAPPLVPAAKVAPSPKQDVPAAQPPRPSVSTKAAEAKGTSTWVYLLAGGLIGFILLLVLAVAVGLWLYLQ